jgi:hypothetical protein
MKLESGDRYLYRIMRFDHAVAALKGKLYFSHPSRWEDPYETHIKHSYDHAVFAQCWSTASRSDAMWRIYSPDYLGVRLRTTEKKLIDAMKVHTSKGGGFKRRLQDVKYLAPAAYKKEIAAIENIMADVDFSGPAQAADLLCVKRSAFKHEQEVRAIFFNAKAMRDEHPAVVGIEVPVDGFELIETVMLDPRAPEELCMAMKHYIKDVLKFPGDVGKSKLYTLPSR